MIINKSFDVLLLGESYLSTLYSCTLQARGAKVIHIEDERITYGHNHTQCLGQLEKNFLQLWGRQEQLPPLINLEEYLRPTSTFLFIGRKQLLLKNDWCRNVGELWRKFPQLFSLKLRRQTAELAKEMEQLAQQWSRHFFDSTKQEKFKRNKTLALLESAPLFSELLNTFVTITERKGTYGEEQHLQFILASTYLSRLEDQVDKLSLAYILLSCLSPRYELDSKRFSQDLQNLFRQKGGQGKKTIISDWQFYRKRPISVLLKSFEGIIHPRQVFIMGGPLHHVPFAVKAQEQQLSGLAWELDLGQARGRPLFLKEHCWLTLSYPDLVGKGPPLLQGRWSPEKDSKLLLFGPAEAEQMTSSLGREHLKRQAQKLFARWVKEHACALDSESISWRSVDMALFWQAESAVLTQNPQHLYARFGPLQGPRLKDVGQWAPEHSNALGTLSFLGQLYRAKDVAPATLSSFQSTTGHTL